MPISYEHLRIIWWLLLGVLLIGFAIMDGFDLGSAMLITLIGKTDDERRIILNAIGPVWEGNQVWFILGGGAIFAAWPALYALSFSSFYLAMMLVLFALILRPVAIKYRSKLAYPAWRTTWDCLLTLSGVIVALVLGIAIGNVLQGVPFYFDDDLRAFYTGNFWQLFSPFTLICGLTSVAMLLMHGALFIAIKSEDLLRARAITAARCSAVSLILLFVIGGIFITKTVNGYYIFGSVLHDGPSNPLHKQVFFSAGAWLTNFINYPILWLFPLLTFIGAFFVLMMAKFSRLAFVASALTIASIIATVGVSMFPFLLPSSTHPDMSLLVWDASSSQLTLFIMLLSALFFMPIIMLYTAWVYRVMRGKVRL